MFLPPKTILVSGPVIIRNNRVLLVKEQKDTGPTPWFFPGGKVERFDEPLEEACKRETREEVGIEIDIIRPLRTLLIQRPEDPEKLVILLHYLALPIGEPNPGPDIVACEWFPTHHLPEDIAQNVKEIIQEYISETT